MRDKRRLSMNKKWGGRGVKVKKKNKRKEKHLSEPDYTDCLLPPRALFVSKCLCVCVCVLVSEGVRLSQPNRTVTFPMSRAGRF